MPEPFLSPREASGFLREAFGVVRTPATLAKLRVIGGGPAYRKLNRAVLYATEDLRAWVSVALEIRRTSTTDEGSNAAVAGTRPNAAPGKGS
ncbi:MAG: hypothetical protein ACHP84_04190 [Caulobacterales bacterium]